MTRAFVSTHPHVEDAAGVSDGLGVGLGVGAAAADVEADADHVQPQLFGPLQEASAGFELRPELHAQATLCL